MDRAHRRARLDAPQWTGAEIRALVHLYPAGGVRACLPVLTMRSKTAIYVTAAKMGVKRAGRKPGSGLRS